ncbi:MAG: AraC family transcriptional regulator, partial [Treponema sp.]|nr:AraC family transcriptional regulator [Treponema sp.]
MHDTEIEYIEHIAELPMKCMVVSLENSGPHWHYEYEVFFVLRGGTNINAEAGRWTLAKDDMFLFNSREIHSFSDPAKDNLCLILQFAPQILTDHYQKPLWFSLNTKGDMPPPPEGARKLRNILAGMALLLYEKPDGYPFLIKSGLYRFIGTLFSYIRYRVGDEGAVIISDTELKEFDKYKQYIKAHFKEDINIEKLCKELGMSKSKLYRIIKSTGADTYKVLINFYRIEYAKNMLRNTNTAIPYISAESGFESESSFYRIFKEQTGIS